MVRQDTTAFISPPSPSPVPPYALPHQQSFTSPAIFYSSPYYGYDNNHSILKHHSRKKRYLTTSTTAGRHRRRPTLLTAPLHFLFRVVPKLLTFPLVQAMRFFSGNPRLLQHHGYRFPPPPYHTRFSPSVKTQHPRPSALHTRNNNNYETIRASRKNNDVNGRRNGLPSPPHHHRHLSKTFLLDRLRQINRLSDVRRKKRSVVFERDRSLSSEFFKFLSEEETAEDEDEDYGDDGDDKDEVLAREFLQPLRVESMIPHGSLFYYLNAPIRVLSHFNHFKDHLKPVFHSLPIIVQNSKNYVRELFKQFHSYILHFLSNVIGDFHEIHPSRGPSDVLLPTNVVDRYRRDVVKNVTDDVNEDARRNKRFVLKVVDEKEVEEFLREKLGDYTNEANEKKTTSTDEKRKRQRRHHQRRNKYAVAPFTPKIVVDNNGKAFVDVNGMKRPIWSYFGRKLSKKENAVGHQTAADDADLKGKINGLIEEATRMVADEKTIDRHQMMKMTSTSSSDPFDDATMHLQMIKDKIDQILTNIRKLIDTDFEKYVDIYDLLLKTQNLKRSVTDEWKQLLVTNRCNDMEGKIRILNVFRQIQANREKILKLIASSLMMGEGGNFMNSKLIGVLVRLQKLQCVVVRIVEDFAGTLHLRTPFDAQKEVRYVEYLQSISLLSEKTKNDIENRLKMERDLEMERQMKLLEKLRRLIENKGGDSVETEIDEHAGILWEMKNIEKLQRDSISELNNKIERGQKIRKELKILFDLQKQLDNAEKRQKELLDKKAKRDAVEEKEDDEEEKGDRLKKTHQEAHQQTRSRTPRRSHHQNNIKSNKFKIWPLLQNKLTPRPTDGTNKDRKPVKIVTNGYTLTGYLTHNNIK